MQVYIAAPFVEKEYAKTVREKLRKAGIGVTSRWLDFPGDSLDPIILTVEAANDFDDVFDADALVLLNLQKRGEETSGKAVETGLALACGKPVYMIGGWSNVFHFLPQVVKCTSVEEMIQCLLT